VGDAQIDTDDVILATADGERYRIPRDRLKQYAVAQSVRFQVGTDVYDVPRDVLLQHEMSEQDVEALRARKAELVGSMGFEASGLGGRSGAGAGPGSWAAQTPGGSSSLTWWRAWKQSMAAQGAGGGGGAQMPPGGGAPRGGGGAWGGGGSRAYWRSLKQAMGSGTPWARRSWQAPSAGGGAPWGQWRSRS
jgi:hypothetical protein